MSQSTKKRKLNLARLSNLCKKGSGPMEEKTRTTMQKETANQLGAPVTCNFFQVDESTTEEETTNEEQKRVYVTNNFSIIFEFNYLPNVINLLFSYQGRKKVED